MILIFIFTIGLGKIFFKKPELPTIEDPFLSEREEYSLRAFYSLKKNHNQLLTYDREYFNEAKRMLGLDFYESYTASFGSVTFLDSPKHPNQKPSCSFKIEVYPDRTVVTPTHKRFCKKPMYYHENYNPNDVIN
ncbi:hypothetical protein [Moraxella equi]|uniref:Uncharacterized protein n=1 Tax=Moraxella equi TaxID=60442 RepID=A0A378QS07_9GAMM|nr:hypothetical protein [Moraxella equi]OPH39598.1 hypothetical protein B5J93_03455 [Moraxella equi]STZ03667.1 Uncharacterised protein [Moraxella equi]